jgi:hypothetical protein
VEGDDEERSLKHMKKKHEVREIKLLNVFHFLLFGVPSFNFAYFDITPYEYNADWTIEEKCFLISCKSHFQNNKRLLDHEAIHKKQHARRSIILSPFWKTH